MGKSGFAAASVSLVGGTRLMRAMTTAFVFLTRLPLAGSKADARTWGRSLMFFPLAGAAVGAPVVAIARASVELVSPVVGAFLAVAAWTWLTRGLHLSGLAATADGWNGSADRSQRKVAVGPHGAIALALVLIGKMVLISELIAHEGTMLLWLVPAAARAAVVPVVLLRRQPGAEGVGKDMNRNAKPGGIAVALASMAGGLWWAGPQHWPALAGAFATAAGVGLWLRGHWRGLTDDAYGAAVELAEVAALLCLLASLSGPY